ncbi:hypothetical protein MEC_00640 [Bartonella alsatica IBS 382]|uniref:Uncharacterized protein n=1 Tax=Bartonella alsatica IBS 382 TaxID=1094551 RepID=J0PY73_9HYPH|nr:hypothetical protein MEC_00640 [Bartonella alsatica IBS 382]
MLLVFGTDKNIPRKEFLVYNNTFDRDTFKKFIFLVVFFRSPLLNMNKNRI